MHISDVIPRIRVIAEAAPFSLHEAREPFGFDLETQQVADASYCVRYQLDHVDARLGLYQDEYYSVTVGLAAHVRRDANAAHARVQTWCSSLQAAITRDGLTRDYDVETDWDVPDPGPDDDYVLGQIEFTVSFERSL